MAKILIVDDEKMICEAFQDVLREEDHEVDIALDGIEALKMVDNKAYDLIFLDVLMPRMEGREVFEAVRKKSEVPIAFMSGYMPRHKEKEVLLLGAVACLRKPIDLHQVKGLINTVTSGKSK
ncbi:MAG: response regulator [Candidatus Omnitrophota bacterium]|nr:response regulator [Candidatus Omnitrophota bacterium]